MDGMMNVELRQAIGEYQAAAGLVASSRVDFDLYASLIDDIQNTLAEVPAGKKAVIRQL
jgi:hypothetical protein